jgi:hypothetical protein
MQANQPVYRLGAVGRLLLTDCCGRHARFTVVKPPQQGDLGGQPPGIGGMSVYTVIMYSVFKGKFQPTTNQY